MFFSSVIAYFNTEEMNLTKNGQSQKKAIKLKTESGRGIWNQNAAPKKGKT